MTNFKFSKPSGVLHTSHLGGPFEIRFMSVSHKSSLVGSILLLYIVEAQAILSHNLLANCHHCAGHMIRATVNSIGGPQFVAG
jgi:hypothetical protein